MALDVKDINLFVGRKQILSQISLSVAQGSVVGLIGPNGSGKSSLIRVIAGLMTPSSGKIKIQGQDISKLSRRTLAQSLAYVQQQADTRDVITVYKAAMLGRTPWLKPFSQNKQIDSEIVLQALENVGIAHKAHQNWQTLSGGERQRVHIARALAQQTPVMVLDEPTNHLDIQHQLAILHLIRQQGHTVLIALHDLNHALLCDQVAVMQNGNLVEIGMPTDVLSEKLISEVFSVKGRLLEDPFDGSQYIKLS